MPKPTFHNLADAKRDKLVEAIIDEFAARPYRLASLDRVAAAGGVSKGSLYQYFSGKLDMYRWLVTEELPRRKLAALGLEAAAPGGDGLFDTLSHAFHAGLALFVREPRLARLASRLAVPEADPELTELHREAARARHGYLVSMIEAARERGEVRADLGVDLAASIIATIMGQGLVDALLRGLGTDLVGFADEPTVLAGVDADDVEALVAEATEVLRRAIGS